MEKKVYNCHFDGSCGPTNPGGTIGIGVHISEGENNFSIDLSVPPSMDNTNNVAEYLAFIKVLKLLSKKENCIINIFGDSKLVIMQMTGEWKLKKGNYINHAREAQTLLSSLKDKNIVNISWIPREQNTIVDELSKKYTL